MAPYLTSPCVVKPSQPNLTKRFQSIYSLIHIEIKTSRKHFLLCGVFHRFSPKRKWKTKQWHSQNRVPSLHFGFLSTRMTLSPLRNILLMNRSLYTGAAAFRPFPVLGISVHSSFTFSRIMLQCLSNAFTCASSFRLVLKI